MHINRTFSLKLTTVEHLNEEVRPKLRSKFVDRAIRNRLKPEEIDVSLLSTNRLMNILLSRDVSEFVKRVVAQELGIDVEAYL
jgi:RAB protein geranylgeranyltransferase component A